MSKELTNSDMPAMPLPIAASTDGCIYDSGEATRGWGAGLTKLEDFTGRAMEGLLSNPNVTAYTPEQVAQASVEYAQAALKALETLED